MRPGVRAEDGFAIIVAMMGLLMMSALGMALVLSTSIETMIAGNFRDGAAAMYAADIVAAHAVRELSTTTDWTSVLAGTMRSSLGDGAPEGLRALDDGSTIDLTEIVNLSNCGTRAACSDVDLSATHAARPWGANNPRWRLFAWGRLADLLPVTGVNVVNAGFYVVLLVADDPAETDGDPLTDGSGPNPGSGVLMLRAEAFGTGGIHAVVEQTVARVPPDDLSRNPGLLDIRVVSWRAGR